MPGRAPPATGRDLDGFRNCALTNVVLLEPGEAADSDRIKATIGPNVMASVYYFYDEVHETRHRPAAVPARASGSHTARWSSRPRRSTGTSAPTNSTTPACIPGEAELIDAQLIRDTCLVGTADELVERIRELEAGRAAGADVRHRQRRQMAARRGFRPPGDGAAVAQP